MKCVCEAYWEFSMQDAQHLQVIIMNQIQF